MAGGGPAVAKVGVLLLNMGGPDRLEAVRPFLNNLFSDRRIIRLPGGRAGQFLLGRLIVNARLKKVKQRYHLIGGGSPIVHWTTRQMDGTQQLLNDRVHDPPKVGMAMRYWHPFADEALRDLERAGVERVIGITLYPHYTRATTGSSEADLVEARERLGLDMPISFVSQWYDFPGYLDLWADVLRMKLESLEASVRSRIHIVVSAHGIPQKFVDGGDPYVDHVQATMEGVLGRLEDPPEAHLAFQSRSGPAEWVGPGTEYVVRELALRGIDALLLWPISFVSDHIETTYEVDMLFREIALEAGVSEYHVVPAFNDDVRFCRVLADLVASRVDQSTEASGK
jgi:ferrochelatase